MSCTEIKCENRIHYNIIFFVEDLHPSGGGSRSRLSVQDGPWNGAESEGDSGVCPPGA